MAREIDEMAERTPLELLDLAVEEARSRGYAVAGWTLQGAEDEGYSAWLYAEDDDWTPGHQVSLSSEVEVQPTAEMAARECYLRAMEMAHSAEEPEA